MRSHLFSCWYASAQAPQDTRRLFDAGCASAGLADDPLHTQLEPRSAAIALALSREWSIADLEGRLVPAIEAQFEPQWDRVRGEFTWGLGLNEDHPRGQYNAFLAAAEAMAPGLWTRLSADPLEPCPQVVGVDFPKVALTRARWTDGALDLTLRAHPADPAASTTFEIVGADLDRQWTLGGSDRSTIERRGKALVVNTPLQSGDLRVEPAECG